MISWITPLEGHSNLHAFVITQMISGNRYQLYQGGEPLLTLFASPLGWHLDVVLISPPKQLVAVEILQM